MHDGVTWKVLLPILLVISGVLGWHTVLLIGNGEKIAVAQANTVISDSRLGRIEEKVDRIWERLR